MPVTESEYELLKGDAAPDFELPGTDGETYSLVDFAEYEALLVVFTCNHCPYAWVKRNSMNGLTEEFEKLAVVGINANDASKKPKDSFSAMQEHVEAGRIRYDAYLRDRTQDVARAYGAVCTPDPFLFRKEGNNFVLAYHGRIDDAMNPEKEPTNFHMREAVQSIIAGEDVEQDFLPSRGCSIKWI